MKTWHVRIMRTYFANRPNPKGENDYALVRKEVSVYSAKARKNRKAVK